MLNPPPRAAPASDDPIPESSPPPERGREHVTNAETVAPAPSSTEPKVDASASKNVPKAGWIVIPNSGKVPVDPTEGPIDGIRRFRYARGLGSQATPPASWGRTPRVTSPLSLSRHCREAIGNRQSNPPAATAAGRPALRRRSHAQPRTRSASRRRNTWSRAGRTTGPSQGSTMARARIIAPSGRQTSESIRISTSFTSMT